MKTFLVTGGAGFIGSNFVLKQRVQRHARIINLDLLTYAGNPKNLESLKGDPDYIFVKGNKQELPDPLTQFLSQNSILPEIPFL